MTATGPTLVRRQLGRRLRQLREQARKTMADVAEAKLASDAKLWRIESGNAPVRVADARALCWLYDADRNTTEALARLAVGTQTQGWWEEFGDVVPSWFGLYVGLESEADRIRIYDPVLVHGLLQTPAYARAVHEAYLPAYQPAALEQAVRLRLERQRTVLGRECPPRITLVVDAAVLARPVGGPGVTTEQLAHLRALDAGHPGTPGAAATAPSRVEVRVLPGSVGVHPGMKGAFTMFDFEDPNDPPVVYVETQIGAHYFEQPTQRAQYEEIFTWLAARSVPLEEYRP